VHPLITAKHFEKLSFFGSFLFTKMVYVDYRQQSSHAILVSIRIMKKQNSKLKLTLLTALATLSILAGVSILLVVRSNSRTSSEPVKVAAAERKFSFTGTAGWWQGATNETSMALFDEDKVMACFTSAEYKQGIVDIAAELKEIEVQIQKSGNGHTMTSLGSQTLAIQTAGGPRQYELHRSTVVTPPGSEKIKAGQEFGYIQFSKGYIKIMGYCDTPEQLPATIPALQAIKFNGTN
jgi:hypothetical protein